MRLRLANAPVSWGIMEVEGWSPPIPYTRVLDEIATAGYTGTELGPYGYLPTDAARLREELARRSLTLTSAFVPLRLKQREGVGEVIEQARVVGRLLAACGAGFMVLADAMWPGREAGAGRASGVGPVLADEEWKVVAENVRRVAAVCRNLGLRCVFHHHAGTYIETPAEVERLLTEVAAADLGLCLDTGHYVYGGGDPVEALRRFGRRVEYLHLKDVRPAVLEQARADRVGFLEGVRRGVFCELGGGAVNFAAVRDELQRLGYDGWAVVEQDVDLNDPACPPPLESARKSRRHLARVLGEEKGKSKKAKGKIKN